MTGAAGAQALRALHRAPALLVLPNVWDAVSARVVAAQPGCRALATASHSVAAALGHPDGERLALADHLAALARIVAATDLPVTADLEAGYAADAAGVRRTLARALETGIVGANLEDGVGERELRPVGEQVQRVRAALAAGADAGIPLVLNARTDAFLVPAGMVGDPAGEAIARGRAYLDAGADLVFVPGVVDAAVIERLVGALGAVSVLAGPGSPPLVALERLGVQRVSFGPGTLGTAMAALAREASVLLRLGPLSSDLGYRA